MFTERLPFCSKLTSWTLVTFRTYISLYSFVSFLTRVSWKPLRSFNPIVTRVTRDTICLLYTSDAADE